MAQQAYFSHLMHLATKAKPVQVYDDHTGLFGFRCGVCSQ